jgi:hypothetical protein
MLIFKSLLLLVILITVNGKPIEEDSKAALNLQENSLTNEQKPVEIEKSVEEQPEKKTSTKKRRKGSKKAAQIVADESEKPAQVEEEKPAEIEKPDEEPEKKKGWNKKWSKKNKKTDKPAVIVAEESAKATLIEQPVKVEDKQAPIVEESKKEPLIEKAEDKPEAKIVEEPSSDKSEKVEDKSAPIVETVAEASKKEPLIEKVEEKPEAKIVEEPSSEKSEKVKDKSAPIVEAVAEESKKESIIETVEEKPAQIVESVAEESLIEQPVKVEDKSAPIVETVAEESKKEPLIEKIEEEPVVETPKAASEPFDDFYSQKLNLRADSDSQEEKRHQQQQQQTAKAAFDQEVEKFLEEELKQQQQQTAKAAFDQEVEKLLAEEPDVFHEENYLYIEPKHEDNADLMPSPGQSFESIEEPLAEVLKPQMAIKSDVKEPEFFEYNYFDRVEPIEEDLMMPISGQSIESAEGPQADVLSPQTGINSDEIEKVEKVNNRLVSQVPAEPIAPADEIVSEPHENAPKTQSLEVAFDDESPISVNSLQSAQVEAPESLEEERKRLTEDMPDFLRDILKLKNKNKS